MTVDSLKALEDSGVIVDRALPQNFYDQVSQGMALHPWTQFVWAYPKGSVFGMPYPLTEGARAWCEQQDIIYYEGDEDEQ